MPKIQKVKTPKGQKGQTMVVSSANEYFDDCPICQAMKKAEEEGRELTEKELLKLFEEVNRKNTN